MHYVSYTLYAVNLPPLFFFFFIFFLFLTTIWSYLSFHLGSAFSHVLAQAFWYKKRKHFFVGSVYCLRDSQVPSFINFSLKLSLTVLFIHLKIILLQCFKFSIINGIQIDLNSLIIIFSKNSID